MADEATPTPAAEAPAEVNPPTTPEGGAPAEPAPEPASLREAVGQSAEREFKANAPQEEAAEEEEEKPAEEEAAETEEESAEEEKPEEAAEEEAEQAKAYTPADIKLAMQIFDEGPEHAEYDLAAEILEELGIVEAAEEEPAEAPEGETDSERRLRLLEEKEERREQAAAQAQKDADAQAALENAEKELFDSLDEHFAADGEQFPRDPEKWTPEQKLQARLTANMEDEGGAEAAKALLDTFGKDKIDAYINTKEDPKDPPITDRAGAPAKNDAEKTPREGIAETARRIAAGAGVQA